MTLQISPVLAGTYDPAPAAATGSAASVQSSTDNNEIDSRRYSKWDRSATDAGSADMSFDDFVDMINPLQHIPVVSSVYREMTGEKINPVSEAVGNAMYGAATGIVGAVVGMVGSVVDGVLQQSTGKGTTGTMMAALFGDSDAANAPTTQLAQASSSQSSSQTSPQTAAQMASGSNTSGNPGANQGTDPSAAPARYTGSIPTKLAAATSSAPNTAAGPLSPTAPGLTSAQINARAKLQATAIASAASAATQASMPSTGKSSPAAQMAPAASASGGGLLGSINANPATALPMNTAKAYSLDQNKTPYGGTADPLQGNTLGMSLANSAPQGMQMNHTVYTGRTFAGMRMQAAAAQAAGASPVAARAPSVPFAATASTAQTTAPAQTSTPSLQPVASSVPPGTYVSTAPSDQLPPALQNDIAALRAINTYRNTATQTGAGPNGNAGTNVNLVN